VLVVPVDGGADANAVGARLAATAASRGEQVHFASEFASPNGLDEGGVRRAVEALEQNPGFTVVPVPRLSDPRTVALLDDRRVVVLVGRAGQLERRNLVRAVETLRRLDVPFAGVVLQGPTGNGARRN
jgi:hypothetical protein